MHRVVPTSWPSRQLCLRKRDSNTYSVSSIAASFQQINAYLTAHSVLRGDSAQSVVFCLLSLEVEEGLRRRKSNTRNT